MIPNMIDKAAILAAIQQIDEEGIPRQRLSHTYNLRYGGKLYPPKYVISLANAKVTGTELPPSMFSGGEESNTFLRKLGFVVEPCSDAGSCETSGTHVVTVTLESSSSKSFDNKSRLSLLGSAVRNSADADVILFPAGFFQLHEQNERKIIALADEVCDFLRKSGVSITVCFGIDCADGEDQLALAVTRDGIIAMGRKFYPTYDERDVIRIARSYDEKEMRYSRFFEIGGKRFYLAVCYDTFGIRHCQLSNPGVDAVLVLAHQFWPRGYGPSGDVDFARKGFAGASQQWDCPVFGTAVFFDRAIPENWPTGVRYHSEQSVKQFKYSDNTLHWTQRVEISESEFAICYWYSI